MEKKMLDVLRTLGNGRQSTETNAGLRDWLRDWPRASSWIMTPHKNPARSVFLRQLTSKNEHLLAQNAELSAKNDQLERFCVERTARLDELSKQSAMDRPLAFMHIGKTSGTALTAGLRAVLPFTPCITGFDHWAFGAFRSFESISPEARLTIYETLPPADGIDFVMGHMAYSTLKQGRPAARFMTVLREPRSRILSQWMFGRSISDETLRPWGAWGRVARLARQPLAAYLRHPEVAYQTDNIAVRMLLWPHPLIPDDGFIDSASDERLQSEAVTRLKAFDFVDVIENPRLEDNVRAFLVRPFVYRRLNETLVPPERQVRLEQELTSEALLRVEHLSRLDVALWRAVAAERIRGSDPRALSDDTFRRTITRHGTLMRPKL
jgi:hypothetical protein